MLGLIYFVLTAKPISIRRLLILFVVVIGSARCLSGVAHIANAPRVSITTAAALTLLAWLSPLMQAAWETLRTRRLELGALGRASTGVWSTYGLGFLLLVSIASRALLNPNKTLTLAGILELSTIGGVIGLVVAALVQSRCERRNSGSPFRADSVKGAH